METSYVGVDPTHTDGAPKVTGALGLQDDGADTVRGRMGVAAGVGAVVGLFMML